MARYTTTVYGWILPEDSGDVDIWGPLIHTFAEAVDAEVNANATAAAAAQATADAAMVDLVDDITPQLGARLDPNSKPIGWDKGADIASASPLVIGTDGNYFDVTGTTNFAAMTIAVNNLFMLQFDGVLTMTHHATNLNLPGGANITTATGDRAIFFSTGANTVHCLSYVRASGKPVIGGSQGKHLIPLTPGFLKSPTTNGAEPYSNERTNGMVRGFSFDKDTQEYLDFVFPAPKSANESAGFTIEFGWTTVGASGNCIWGLQMAALSDNDPVDPAWGTAVEVTDGVHAANDYMQSDISATCTPSGTWAEGDLIKGRIYRKAADASDTLADDAILLASKLWFTTNADTDD